MRYVAFHKVWPNAQYREDYRARLSTIVMLPWQRCRCSSSKVVPVRDGIRVDKHVDWIKCLIWNHQSDCDCAIHLVSIPHRQSTTATVNMTCYFLLQWDISPSLSQLGSFLSAFSCLFTNRITSLWTRKTRVEWRAWHRISLVLLILGS